jgi:aminoglycoside/choline kinase family phosphotransferase
VNIATKASKSDSPNQLALDLRTMIDHLDRGETIVDGWVAKNTRSIERIVKLPGDASTRGYYRLWTKEKSLVLMKMENFSAEGANLPFLVLQKHLSRNGIDVPTVLDFDPDRGMILLEDLGDVTLLRRLQDVSTPEVERDLYEQIIDSVVDLQLQASPKAGSPELEAFKLRFDHKKLMWEVNFTIEHFYKTYLAREIREKDLAVLTKRFGEFCQTLADQPTVFTHRDFHSRNIMVTPVGGDENRLVMIDFQDARMGPAQYDLASLLKDSYYQLEDAQVHKLVDYYIVRRETLSGIRIDREEFWRVFDMMSVQRNFKAIGSFASFLNRRGNPGYLKYIGNTFENVRRTLLKYPEYSDLREVLFHYYYF